MSLLKVHSTYAMYDVCESLVTAYSVSRRKEEVSRLRDAVGEDPDLFRCQKGIDAAMRGLE